MFGVKIALNLDATPLSSGTNVIKLFRFIALITLLHVSPSMSLPILSADGSVLSGVNVAGYGIYDVMIGEGIMGDVFSGVTFDVARAAEADSVSLAIVSALQELGVAPTAVAGCTVPVCYIIIPDQFVVPYFDPGSPEPWYLDEAPVMFDPLAPVNFGEVWVSSPSISSYSHPLFDTSTFSTATIGWYERRTSAVPAPTSMLLVALGLVLLGGRRGFIAGSERLS